MSNLKKQIAEFRNILAHSEKQGWPLPGDDARRVAVELWETLQVIKDVVDRQADDEGLWFVARYASEVYLQQQLRYLHTSIEGHVATNQPTEGKQDE